MTQDVWVRDHSDHTPAHRALSTFGEYTQLACATSVKGGHLITEAAARRQQVMPCRRCFGIPKPYISSRFGEAA